MICLCILVLLDIGEVSCRNITTFVPQKFFSLNVTYTNASLVNSTDVAVNVSESALVSGKSKESTSAIIIASVTVAVAVVVFICVLYKFHVIQLNAKQREFADQLVACSYPSPCLSRTPRRSDSQATSLLQAGQPKSDADHVTFQTSGSGHTGSLRSPSPSMLSPTSLGSKRGSRCSTWSSLSDQEVFLSISPSRNNSTVRL